MRKFLFVLVTALLVAATSSSVLAQGTASLTGTVSDQTGAVVQGAKVTTTHVRTNESRTATTNEAGIYRFPNLPVGNYKLKVEAEGFKLFEVTNVLLTVGETVTQNVTLEVGSLAEVVTVMGEGMQLVQTADTTVSGLIDSTTVSQLPLEVREPSAFVNLMAGTVQGNVISNAIGTGSRGAAVHGARSGTGNFTVDGYDNNDQGQGGRGGSGAAFGAPGAMTGISPDAIQEFRVITSNFEAQHGRAGGFVSNVTLKSGTNEFHGSAFLYNRVQALAANSWASNVAGIEDALVRNQFGGSMGGPVIPDKMFFFSSLELHRLRTQGPTTVTSVTPEFINFVRSGAFATFHESDPNGLCMQVNGMPCPGAFAMSRTLGPVVGPLVQQFGYPVPSSNFTNIGGGLVTSGIEYPVNVYGTAAGINSAPLNQNRFTLKLDAIVSEKDRFSGTFLFDDIDAAGSFGGDFFNPAFPFENPARNQVFGLTYARTFSPTLINEFKVSYLRDRSDFPQLLDNEPPSIITIFDPLTTSLGRAGALPQFFTNNQFQYQDNVTYLYGRHSFRSGGEYRRTRNGSAFEALKNAEWDFNDIESVLTDGAFGDESDRVVPDLVASICGGPCGGGLGVASVNPVTHTLPEYYRGYRANEFGAYLQDNWRVHPRLTLNLGLRWEYQGPPHNFRGGLDSNFYFGAATLPSPSVQPAWRSCDGVADATDNPFFPCTADILRRVANGQFAQRDSNIWAKDTNNFAPRFGFAWDLFGTQKLVIRGGGGVFYDRIWNNLFENIRFNPPFFAFAGTGSLFDGTPVGPLSLPGFFQFPINPALYASSGAASPRHMDENLLLPYIQQYNFGIQWQFANDYAFHVTYVSTQGRKLTGLIDLNTFPGRTAGIGSSARPNRNIGSDNSRTNAFGSNYHGMEVQLLKRFSAGLQFQANYTFSKAIDEISDAFSGKDALRPTNPFNIRLDRGRADFDINHRFVTSLYYDIPLWKENRVLGGWTTSTIITLQSGTPFSINASFDSNRDGYTTDRAHFVGTGDVRDLINHNVSPADGYLTTRDSSGNPLFIRTPLNPARNQGAWIDGTLGRNILTGPGFANVDWSLAKRFRFTEVAGLQIQFNFFNLFNRPNFYLQPGEQSINSGSFGRPTNTFSPRIIQIGARIDW